jgi:glycosyltransferase involved in cell wall biosynthesis
LGESAHIDLFVDGFEPANQAIVERFAVFPVDQYAERRWQYDWPVYHMGNNLYHAAIYRTALDFPGVVVLHDFSLVGIISSMTWAEGDMAGFFRDWGYVYGPEGIARARRIVDGRESLPSDEPLNRRLLDLSLGLLVHSEFAQRRVWSVNPRAQVECVPMPWVSHRPAGLDRAEARRQLGLEEDAIYIGSFGFMSPSKQIEPLLDAFERASDQVPQLRLLFVGEPLAGYDPEALIARRGLADSVRITGFLPFSGWYTYVAAVDLAVNLRFPTLGETSASVLRLLGEGVPTIVSDVGWYAELPDDCVVKVAVGDALVQELASALVDLLQEPDVRARLGENARQYVIAHHHAERAARKLVQALERFGQRYAL